jgi:hypothetical protein
MSEQINSGQVDEPGTPEASGLLLSVEPLQASAGLSATDGSDTHQDGSDSASHDGGTDGGSDSSDADGSDTKGTDGSDSTGADTDLTDALGADTDGSDGSADADGTDDSDSSIKIDSKDA